MPGLRDLRPVSNAAVIGVMGDVFLIGVMNDLPDDPPPSVVLANRFTDEAIRGGTAHAVGARPSRRTVRRG